MTKEIFLPKEGNILMIKPEELEHLFDEKNNKYDSAQSEIINSISELTELNVYEVTRRLIENQKAKLMLKAEIFNRIFNFQPISADDVAACQNNDSSWTTISDITGNSLGISYPEDVVYREGEKVIYLVKRNQINGIRHYISIPRDILVDILKVAFLRASSIINIKVPVSESQKEILNKILATANSK